MATKHLINASLGPSKCCTTKLSLGRFNFARSIALAPEKQKAKMLSGCVRNEDVTEGNQQDEESPRSQRQISQNQKEENGRKKERRAENMLCGAPILSLLSKMNFTGSIIFFQCAREDSNDEACQSFLIMVSDRSNEN
jgi:hypothetical protein